MINFKSPEISDWAAAAKAVADSGYTGSDASFANIYLLRQKYGTKIALQEGILFRYYNGQGSRRGYAFPLGEGDAGAALALIVEDARESGRPLEFCLVDEPRAQILREYFKTVGANGAKSALHFTENRGDSDYIYSAESLATLAGNSTRKNATTFLDLTGLIRTTKFVRLRRRILQTRSQSKRAGSISKPWANPAIPTANAPANAAKPPGRNAPKMKNPDSRNTALSARHSKTLMLSA